MIRWLLTITSLFPLFLAAETITIKTQAPHNPQVVFHYRVPQCYDHNRREMYRVLVIFGGRNTTGQDDASGRLGWAEWCDSNGIFIVAPGFRDDNYWEPAVWSGRALQQALQLLKRRYNICTDKLLFYGYSAGSQASNLFASWKPAMCRAWVSHACGVFHKPTQKMRYTPGLVTCGEADPARYIISRHFVYHYRIIGINIIMKSFPNHAHDVPFQSLELARAFLLYYHRRCIYDLSGQQKPFLFPPVEFVGDDQDAVYYPVGTPQAKNILQEDRVYLPDKSIAEAWGEEG